MTHLDVSSLLEVLVSCGDLKLAKSQWATAMQEQTRVFFIVIGISKSAHLFLHAHVYMPAGSITYCFVCAHFVQNFNYCAPNSQFHI